MKKDLTFKKLRKTNLKRCETHFHLLHDWSETDWACALSGEVGELCNFLKKRRRNSEDKSLYLEDCKKEIGDIGAYLDLISAKLGFKLEDCIRDKFNEVSKRKKGCKFKL